MNQTKNEIVNAFGGILKNPQKFYFLLLLSGMSAGQAQQLVYDIKYAKIRLSSTTARKKIIQVLSKIINMITSDNMLYNRFRMLAQNEHVFKEEMSVGSGAIAGLGFPSAEADPPPVPVKALLKYAKKNTKNKNKMNPLIFEDQVLKRNSA
jgi:hypothetical protein